MKSRPNAPLFLCEDLTVTATSQEIRGDEASHAVRSRRLGEGDHLFVTNGRGLLAEGSILNIERKPDRILMHLTAVTESPPPATERILATALPKGDRLNTLLDMATQLGMDTFQPLDCVRSVVRAQPRALERWQRVIVSAAKQCRQTRFPEIRSLISLADLLASVSETDLLLYGDADGTSLYRGTQGIIPRPDRVFLAVGPEGGFDERETDLLQQCPRAIGVACGSLVLRTETAGPALLSAVNQWLMDTATPEIQTTT